MKIDFKKVVPSWLSWTIVGVEAVVTLIFGILMIAH